MASLYRAMDALDAKGRAYLADPVLDPINFGFMDLARALCRAPARAAEGRDAARHRQSHRADRRRHDRHHRRAARHRLGAAHQERARGAGEPAYAAHRRGARSRAAHHVRLARRPRSAQGLRLRAALRCMRAARSRRRRRRSPRAAGEVRDKNFRIEIAEDGIHIYQSRRPSHRAGCVRSLSEARRRQGRARMPSISASSSPAPRSPGGSPSATPRTSRSTGALPPTRRPTTRRG